MFEDPQPQKKVRWGLIIVSGFFILTCGCLGGVGYFGAGPIDIGPEARDAERIAAEYRAAGLPWEAKDLTKELGARPGTNGGPILLGIAKLPETERFSKELSRMQDAATDGDWARVDEGFKTDELIMKVLDKVAASDKLDFQRDYDLGSVLTFTELTISKDAVRAFCLKARRAAAKGDVSGAIMEFNKAFKLSAMMRDDPTLIGMLVQIAEHSAALASVRACAAQLKDNPAGLAQLTALTERNAEVPDLEYSLRGEMYMGIAILRNVDQYGGFRNLIRNVSGGDDPGSDVDQGPKIDPTKLVRTGLPGSTIARALMARHIQVWLEAKQKMDLHPGDPEGMAKELDVITERIGKSPKASEMFLEILFPVFSQAGAAVVQDEAQVVITEAMVAALKYRHEHGALPKTMAEIPGDFKDPFTKEPLKLKSVNGSMRIYSVGRNHKDDGGLTRSESKEHESDDVVAAYPPLPRQNPFSKSKAPIKKPTP